MKTLHLYRWRDKQTLSNHLPIIGKNDSLVIYGAVNKETFGLIAKYLADITSKWYLVLPDDSPNMNAQQITNSEWLRLIMSHKNTLAWK